MVVLDLLIGFFFFFFLFCNLQEAVQETVVEVGTPCKDQSSRTSEEEEKNQPQEPENMEETPSHGGRLSAAAANEAAAGRTVALNEPTLMLLKSEKCCRDG